MRVLKGSAPVHEYKAKERGGSSRSRADDVINTNFDLRARFLIFDFMFVSAPGMDCQKYAKK